jgi:transcriptional regulator with XRE-family HTH domain
MKEVSEKHIAEKTESLMKLIGFNIKKYRILKQMSRVDLAFYAKTTESMICNIENGKKPGISIYTIVKISEALKINLSLLFEK